MKIDKKIHNSMENLIRIWTLDIDGDVPVKFEDEMAATFFLNSVHSIVRSYYIMGKKHERRSRKRKLSKRFKKNENNR